MKRRNLSGVFLYEKFEDDDDKKPTCFEECSIEKQKLFLDSLTPEGVKLLAIKLADTLKQIGNDLDLEMIKNE